MRANEDLLFSCAVMGPKDVSVLSNQIKGMGAVTRSNLVLILWFLQAFKQVFLLGSLMWRFL